MTSAAAQAAATDADIGLPFARLDPHTVLDALEAIGLRCDGHLQALNSFENRVYLVGLDNGTSRVAKFYRPGRWQRAQLLEEHQFARELVAAEIPLAAPLPRAMLMASDDELQRWQEAMLDDDHDPAFMMQDAGDTLFESHGFFIAVHQRHGGRVPELDNIRHGPAMRHRIGQFIARIHQVGARRGFQARSSIDSRHDGWEAIEAVLASGWLPDDLREGWEGLVRQCCTLIGQQLHPPGIDLNWIRLHGDCHLGNLLWTEAHGPHFVDLDDCRAGPAIQDLWMIADAAGTHADGQAEVPFGAASQAMLELLEGYEQIRPFDHRELVLVEALRTLRMIRHSAWLAARWRDPAFPAAFPWFGSQPYWQGQILHLREQLALLQQHPLPE